MGSKAAARVLQHSKGMPTVLLNDHHVKFCFKAVKRSRYIC